MRRAALTFQASVGQTVDARHPGVALAEIVLLPGDDDTTPIGVAGDLDVREARLRVGRLERGVGAQRSVSMHELDVDRVTGGVVVLPRHGQIVADDARLEEPRLERRASCSTATAAASSPARSVA